MAHNLSTASGRAEMFYTGTTPWHGLGQHVAEAPDSAAAMRLARLDWDVQLCPLTTQFNFDTLDAPGFALVRTDVGKVLSVVGQRYQPVQNREAFAFLDAAVAGNETRYETAGALDDGRRVWLLARMPKSDFTVGKDDRTEAYALMATSHDGSSAVRVLPTSVRVVCQNTLGLALRGSRTGLSIRHTGEVKDKLDAAQQVLGTVARRMEQAKDEAQRLAAARVDDKTAVEYWQTLLPTDAYRIAGIERHAKPAPLTLDAVVAATAKSDAVVLELLSAAESRRLETAEREAERNREALGAILGNYVMHGQAETRGTAWAAYNAVSEWTDHQRQYRGRDQRARLESRMDSVLFGQCAQLKQQAYSAALTLAN